MAGNTHLPLSDLAISKLITFWDLNENWINWENQKVKRSALNMVFGIYIYMILHVCLYTGIFPSHQCSIQIKWSNIIFNS